MLLPFYPLHYFNMTSFRFLIIDIQSTVLCASAHFSALLSALDYAQHLR